MATTSSTGRSAAIAMPRRGGITAPIVPGITAPA